MLSIWEQQGFQGDQDLVVVGAGLVGLFTALHYQRKFPGHRVLVLERGAHPAGASVKNAGFACFGSPSEILADMDAEGADAALARVEERWRGLLELRAELGDEAIGFDPCGGHEVYGAGDALYTGVAERFDQLNRLLHPIFDRPAYEWQDQRIGDLGLVAAHLAFTPLEGSVNTGRMMRSLVTRVIGAGVQVRFLQHVQAVHDTGASVVVDLKNGERISCANAVIATNGYASELLPGIDVVPARGQVLLTSPIPGLRLKGTFHADEGYYYYRNYEGRVLLGGGRNLDKAGETTSADGLTPLIQNALEQMLRTTIIPGVDFTIEHRWSGIMGFRGQGKSPLVEHRSPRVVVAAGLSGMGVAIGIRVARKAAELVAG
jgi:glycine/D-amino acid oxidase-like deaminating enzyme